MRAQDVPLLQVDGLVKHFGTTRAVDGVDLVVRRGETVGLVGESGSGKTTLGQAVLRMTSPTAGRVLFDGRDLATFSRRQLQRARPRMQYIFQDPYGALNPRMTVGDAVGEPLLQHRLATRSTVDALVAEVLGICGMPADAARRYPHEFSGGQRQRVVIARAMALGPELVVADEPVSALDVSVQAQIINLFSDLREQRETAFLFISHDLGVVWHLCDRVVVMERGRVVESGTRGQIFTDARHPYTRALIAAVPVSDPRDRRRHVVADLLGRDPERGMTAGQDAPRAELRDVGDGHLVAVSDEVMSGGVRELSRSAGSSAPGPSPAGASRSGSAAVPR
ncbi:MULTISPECIES: ATP-binding cassette domain-containing protein [unclassified Corynebacterium]|uniref:ATP-binding cassette domain-containing protein n=2 Tax=Corynebacterium TaxID=1716 RepID=UPI002648CA87|nr:ATP-binding cassette domain-containing protein [Corynebacterium sp.]MDN5720209.1 ATP-binding cassette domain-containing protein [Corynebacterium sp.]MDN6324808.1 ATP-binding cassette domain-containing protein [Corynebacterium sp.]MDN6511282.1 ATP-binding cassette domain-containing protein [Corynebacterium sp.]